MSSTSFRPIYLVFSEIDYLAYLARINCRKSSFSDSEDSIFDIPPFLRQAILPPYEPPVSSNSITPISRIHPGRAPIQEKISRIGNPTAREYFTERASFD